MIPTVPRNQIRHCRGQSLWLAGRLFNKSDTAYVELFENSIACLFHTNHAISFSSCRAATASLLQVMGYPHGSKILMPSLNYPAMPLTVQNQNLQVLWVPVKPHSLEPDFDKLCAKELSGAIALIWPHYFGYPAPVDKLLAFCGEHNLDFIEDCAHAPGTLWEGQPVGSFGKAAVVSFETSKLINTFGGGMVLTSDRVISDRLRKARNTLQEKGKLETFKGVAKSYIESILTNRWVFTFTLYPLLMNSKLGHKSDFIEEGLHSPTVKTTAPLTHLQAEAGLKHMDSFKETLNILSKQWNSVQEAIQIAGKSIGVQPKGTPNGFMTVGISQNAELLSATFFKRGIDIKLRYMKDCQKLGFGLGAKDCDPIADKLFHIPIRTDLSEKNVFRYIETINTCLRKES